MNAWSEAISATIEHLAKAHAEMSGVILGLSGQPEAIAAAINAQRAIWEVFSQVKDLDRQLLDGCSHE